MSKLEVDAIEPQSGTTLTIGASGDSVNIASGATITDFTSTGIDDNATSTAITIDSSEQVGIGTASPDAELHVEATTGAELILSRNDTSIAVDDLIGGIQFKSNDASSSPDPQICGIKAISTGATNTNPKLSFFAGESNYNANTPDMIIDSSGNLKFNSGYGSVETAYGCRAWVSFNGTGTVAINDSGNVTSITDDGVGIYTVNFTTNMPDTNYSCMATPGFATSTGLNFNASVHAPAVGSFVLRTRNVNTGNQGDLSLITSAVFR